MFTKLKQYYFLQPYKDAIEIDFTDSSNLFYKQHNKRTLDFLNFPELFYKQHNKRELSYVTYAVKNLKRKDYKETLSYLGIVVKRRIETLQIIDKENRYYATCTITNKIHRTLPLT